MLTFDSRYCFVLALAAIVVGCESGTGDPPAQGGSSSEACDPTIIECPFGSYCRADGCGEGQCIEGPPGCTGACDGVCGCDGTYYCNECSAHLAGVDIVTGAPCTAPPPAYDVRDYGLEHGVVVVTMFDPGRDVCIKLTLDRGGETSLQFDLGIPEPWVLREIVATSSALDCQAAPNDCDLPAALQGEVVDVVDATGSITVDELPGNISPQVGVDLALTFDRPWLEPIEKLVVASGETQACP